MKCPFKVDASKENLERYYKRELTGQEVETVRKIIRHRINVPSDAPDDPYLQHKADGFVSGSNSRNIFDLWMEPERPLSDFLPAPKAPSSDLCCAECRYTETCQIYKKFPKIAGGNQDRTFYCADFESLTTGLGVRNTILSDTLGEFQVSEWTPPAGKIESVTFNGVALREKEPTPNCAKCQWFKELNGNEPEPFCCSAIGMKAAESCHGTRECRALYVEKPAGGGK